MIMILVAIVFSGIASAALLLYSDKDWGGPGTFSAFTGIMLATGTGVAGFGYAVLCWSWMAAEYKVEIINREYGTHYTQAELFWASDVINMVRELDRKRVEINGDIMRESK